MLRSQEGREWFLRSLYAIFPFDEIEKEEDYAT
jgi:hypothetical protein